MTASEPFAPSPDEPTPPTLAPDGDWIDLHDDPAPTAASSAVWHVLVVDDDPEVHAATRFVMRGQRLLGREVVLHSAYSASDAREQLALRRDYAVVLLDVVMEEPDAGLKLVHYIRGELSLTGVRIILRTGQPGYAPEIDVITQYDINDYRTKSELTQTRLVTSLISALRSHEQIRRIEAGRRGLTQIILATRELISRDGLQRFASGVLTQLGAFLSLNPERGLVVISPRALPILAMPRDDAGTALSEAEVNRQSVQPHVIAASGSYAGLVNRDIDDVQPPQVREQLLQSLHGQRNVYSEAGCALFCNSLRHHLAVFVDTPHGVDETLRELLEIFTENIALCADNLSLLAELQRAAFADSLTGLPSRLRLLQRLNDEPLGVPAVSCGLLMIDIDDFNTSVETLGPTGSDELLCAVAARLQGLMADPALLVVRIGADVFAVHGPLTQLTADSLQPLCAKEFAVQGVPIRISVNAGLAKASDAPGPGANLLAAAYLALKRSKQHRRRQLTVYEPEMGARALRRAKLLQALHNGLQASELRLALQPQWRLDGGEVLGVEALLRWQPSGHSPVTPAEVIEVAEGSGLIVALGDWVIDEACRQLAEVQRRTGRSLRMAINVSPTQWRDPNLLMRLRDALARHALAPQQIEIELTETLAMEDIESVLPRLQQARELGLRIALDDFGTGFSSLAYLQHMPIDQLKIDRSFVREIGRSQRGEDIARTIIQLGAMLGLDVLAEGVETTAQREVLQALGCDSAQGYLVAEPMALDALCDWLGPATPGA